MSSADHEYSETYVNLWYWGMLHSNLRGIIWMSIAVGLEDVSTYINANNMSWVTDRL